MKERIRRLRKRFLRPNVLLSPMVVLLTLAQCVPDPEPPPPAPTCAGGIYNEHGYNDGIQESYSALCSSGQGWIEVQIVCASIEAVWNASYRETHFARAYRPLNYINPNATNEFMRNTLVVTATCPRYFQYIWPAVTSVFTYR
jgi:hypothetical protein